MIEADGSTVSSMHVYEVRPRRDHRGVDLISDVLPFGRLWYARPQASGNAVSYAMHYSRSHDAVIRTSRTDRCRGVDLRIPASDEINRALDQ
jgi:hypothetical protein